LDPKGEKKNTQLLISLTQNISLICVLIRLELLKEFLDLITWMIIS